VAGSIGDAGIGLFVLNGSLEESFARFAGEQSVMIAGDFIAANWTQFFNSFLGVG
jgi:hypothetical protein